MDNKGRTYLFTFLVLASVLVVVTAMSFVSAGGGGKAVCGDGVCSGKETVDTCQADCGGITPMDVGSGCQIKWANGNTKDVTTIDGQTIHRCAIGSTNGCFGTVSATTCTELQTEFQSEGSVFKSFLINHCGWQDGVGPSVNTVDHTGCGYGNVGCGSISNPTGRAVACYVGSSQVVDPMELTLNGVTDFVIVPTGGGSAPQTADGAVEILAASTTVPSSTLPSIVVPSDSCDSVQLLSGKYLAHATSTSGLCAYMNANNPH